MPDQRDYAEIRESHNSDTLLTTYNYKICQDYGMELLWSFVPQIINDAIRNDY